MPGQPVSATSSPPRLSFRGYFRLALSLWTAVILAFTAAFVAGQYAERRTHAESQARAVLETTGAVSVNVPIPGFWDEQPEVCALVLAGHGLLWAIGTAVIVLVGRRMNRRLEERHAIFAELRRAKDRAEDANRAKSQFLANVSHEIRTPLTAILGYSELLLGDEADAAQRRGHLETIHRNGEVLLRLVSDILALSKIEAGRLTVEAAACSPWELASDVAALMRPRAEEKGLALALEPCFPFPRTVHTDPIRLRQILVNLVGNAVKFTERGRVTVAVGWYDGPAGRRLWFRVEDSGIGMTGEQLDALFQPFHQADASAARRFGGTGLGLAISKRLAAALGGDIEVQSRPGQGSRFTLWIDPGKIRSPLLLSLPQAKAQAAAPVAGPTALAGRVLVAEDGPDNQRLLRHILRKAGLEADLAEDGRIACRMVWQAAAEGRPYHVILMDMQMPEIDGYEATRRLREKGWTGPIVALTAHAMEGDRAKCLAAGCDEYLAKPVDRGALLALLSGYCPSAEPAATEGFGS